MYFGYETKERFSFNVLKERINFRTLQLFPFAIWSQVIQYVYFYITYFLKLGQKPWIIFFNVFPAMYHNLKINLHSLRLSGLFVSNIF